MLDLDAVAKLKAYTEAHAELRKHSILPILKKLVEDKLIGSFTVSHAMADLEILAERGATRYGREFGVRWRDIFPARERTRVANEWLEEFEREYAAGNYDHMLTEDDRKRIRRLAHMRARGQT